MAVNILGPYRIANKRDSFVCFFLSSPSEKDMLVNDQDIQVLYENCSSNECTKACYKEVGFTVLM